MSQQGVKFDINLHITMGVNNDKDWAKYFFP